MASFSIAEAAFAGFRIIRERPKTFGVWLGINLVVSVGFSAAMMATVMPAMTSLVSASRRPGADPAAAMNAMSHLAPLYALSFLFSLVFYPVVFSTMDRAVLRPNEDRFGYLRLGADEFRQFVLMVLYVVVMFGVYLACGLAFFVVTMVVGVAGAAGGAGGAALSGLVIFVMAFGMMGGLAYFAARFSLASPLTFDTQKIDLFGSWSLTKGKVWALVGTGALVSVLSVTLMLTAGLVAALASAIPGLHSNLMQFYLKGGDLSALSNGLTPGMLVSQIILATMNTVLIPLWILPPAVIYRSLTAGTKRVEVAEVFS